MGTRRRQPAEENDQRSFWFVFTTDESQFHQPIQVTLQRLNFLKKRDEESDAA